MQRTFVLILLLTLGAGVHDGIGQDKDGFELIKTDGRISVYERWINYPLPTSTTQAREVKGEFTINSNIYAGLALIKNEKRIKDWQSHVSEFKIYPEPDTTSWLEYSYHDIPWPVSDQDHFLRYRLSVIKPDHILLVTFESAEDLKRIPVREDVARMGLTGSWRFEKINAKQIKVIYKIISKPSSIPKFFTDPVIRRNIMTTIQSYTDILEGKK